MSDTHTLPGSDEPTEGGPASTYTLGDHDEGPPETIGRYRITGRLGAGGMGVVFVGEDPRLGREVAIKLVAPLPGTDAERARARMLAEARALAQLSHPNVVTVYDVGLHREAVFIAMERLRGRTIAAWVSEAIPTWNNVLSALCAAADGLRAAHAAGIVHRDFKPLNVMLTESPQRVVVLDFGLATEIGKDAMTSPNLLELSERAGATVGFVGTPGYASPEQIEGRPVDARADVFGFCATAYELLLGESPFEGSSAWERMAATVEGRLRPAPHRTPVPRRVIEALRRGLRAAPEERFATMAELLAELRRPPRSRRTFALGASVVLVVGVGVGVWWRSPDPSCARLRALASSLWDEPRRSGLGDRLEHDVGGGPAYSAAVVASVDGSMARWHDSTESLCANATRSRPLLSLHQECLEQWLGELDMALTVVESGDGFATDYALQAVEGLFPVAWCETASEVDRGGIVDGAHELGRELQQAATIIRTARTEEGVELVRRVLARAPPASLAHVRAQLILVGGLVKLKRADEAIEVLEAVYREATAASMDGVAAVAAIELASLLAHTGGDAERMALWERHAEAAISRANPTGPMAARIEFHRAVIDLRSGREASALTRAQTAGERYRAFGQVHGAANAGNLEADVLRRLDRAAEAQQVLRRTLTDAEPVLGSNNPLIKQLRDKLQQAEQAVP
jgi:serine/threonine protein kinase